MRALSTLPKLAAIVALVCGSHASQGCSSRDGTDTVEARCKRLPLAPATQTPCCGCLCVDPHWSCSEDTCTDETGRVVELAAEAGFLEIEPLEATGEGSMAHPASERARVWYSFFPADEAPEGKPLFVFMQGGPAAGMMPLWGGNTGPNTLDTLYRGGGIAPNPYSFGQLGNLLYIDTSIAGFSYRMRPGAGGDSCEPGFDPDREAAQYVRTLLRFLARHPAIQAAPVIFVAESYGGVRATLMLQQLLHPEALREDAGSYIDPLLATEIETHVHAVALDRCAPEPPLLETIRAQFQRQILVQPAVIGDRQTLGFNAPGNLCAPNAADRLSNAEQDVRLEHMLAQIANGASLSAFVGVNVESIRWLHAEERARGCWREGYGPDALATLADTFGALPWWDAFYVQLARRSTAPQPRSKFGELPDLSRPRFAQLFLDNLRHVKTFVTDARCDQVLELDELLTGLQTLEGVDSAQLEPHVDPRVRDIALRLRDGETRSIRFPEYPSAGHTVALHDPETFFGDVRSWLEEDSALAMPQ